MRKITILGATGTFGKALVKKLSDDKSLHLTLVSRHATAHYTENGYCRVIDCDATDIEDLQQAIAGCDAVYCAISGNDLPVVASNVVAAMEKENVRRLIFMGAVGIYNEIPADMNDEDNARNNPDQIPNREAVEIVENSGLDYTVLRPGYLQEGDKDDFVLTFKGEQAKGYVSTIPSVVELAERLLNDENLYLRQSVSITKAMSHE